jgi:Carboxypeptidase regulatory-like domain
MRRFYLLTAAALLFASRLTAQAQGPLLVGHVTDSAGSPLGSASVLVHGTAYQAMTDSMGRFEFATLPVGVISVRALFIGYRSHQIDSVRVAQGRTAQADFQLRPSGLKSGCIMRVGATATE